VGHEIVKQPNASSLEHRSSDRLDRIFDLLTDEVAERLAQRGIISVADESPRPTKEKESWRDEKKGTESSAPTKNETNGESSLLKKEVRELVVSLRQKARRARQSASPSVISKGSRG
jgi:hypothetical protein